MPVANSRIATYRDLIGIGEGLSFSDIHDDSIPYEVKPPQSLCPMEETDFPTQAKDLFKQVREDVLKHGSDYWLDPQGKFNYTREGHAYWGLKHCLKNNIKFDEMYDSTIYEALYRLHFLRIKVTNERELYVDYDREWPPSNLQWRKLKDSAIENHLKLIDAGNGQRREIDLFESVKGDSFVFIGRMKPEQKEEFKSALAQLFSHLREELKLKSVPKIHLLEDDTNSKKLLGRTGYYDPSTQKICLYMTGRHPKDILRSFSHEVIHHWQHENKQLDKSDASEGANKDPQYAQNDPWMRQMEKQAYLLGNMMFRDWEDGKKAEDRKSSKKLSEKTLPIGKGYHPKKPDYRG